MAMHNPPHPGGIVRRQCPDTLDFSVTEAERAWRNASNAIQSDQGEGWNFDRYGYSSVEGIRFKSGILARFANGVRSLAGA